MRWRRAFLIGTVLGLVFLAHTIPAILLSAIVAVDALVGTGPRVRKFLWLAIVAVVELVWSIPFLGPLVARYHLQIANVEPGLWVDPLMRPSIAKVFAMLAVNTPGVVALIGAWLLHRRQVSLPRRSAAVLAAWIGVCVLFLARYYGCTAVDGGATCRALALPVHHFLFYLQAAGACLIGHVIWQSASCAKFFGPRRRALVHAALISSLIAVPVAWGLLDYLDFSPVAGARLDYSLHIAWACLTGFAIWLAVRSATIPSPLQHTVFAVAAAAVLAVNAIWVLYSPFDHGMRWASQNDGQTFDSEAYRWLLANTQPQDLFVTELYLHMPNRAAMTVMATGRRLVAAPLFHSNPYLNWQERDARRQRYLAAAEQIESDPELCELAHEAGVDASAWYLLPKGAGVAAPRLRPVFESGYEVLYRLSSTGCD